MVVERLAGRWNIDLTDDRPSFVGGPGNVAGHGFYLARNQTFMNLSGEAARGLSNKMGRVTRNLIVVHDDIDLPLGRVRLKDDGSDGGHRGIRSIIQALGTREFFRVKVGVGRPEDGITPVNQFVLAPFTPEERPRLDQGVEMAADAVEHMLRDGFLNAQSHIHSQS